MIKKLSSMIVIFILALATATPVFGDVPYRGFTYGYWGNPTPAPAAYVAVKSISARHISPELGAFSMPQDVFVDRNNIIYLLDTGNNRIIVFDGDLNLLNIIDSFVMDGNLETFNGPRGIFVTDNLDIYIADTENRRVIALDQEGNFLRINEGPDHDVLEDDFPFFPLRINVDLAGRQFVIARGVFEGIMRFDSRGRFTGYYGTIRVSVNPMDWFWRMMATQEQRARQMLFIPTEFTGMSIDEYGFIFTTNVDTGLGNAVQRLNPSGDDVLANFTNQRISGTQNYREMGMFGGPSVFVDITVRGNGMYTALDSNRGRLYTYDSEGNLLYVFGGTGNVVGMQRIPAAVAAIDDRILVLDQLRGELTFFEPTEYGRLINEAIALRYDGDEASAVEVWHRVLELDQNYQLALVGIGKSLLAAGENRAAMGYLRRGMNIDYYSVAFRRYRTELLRANINWILIGLMVPFVLKSGYSMYKKRARGRQA